MGMTTNIDNRIIKLTIIIMNVMIGNHSISIKAQKVWWRKEEEKKQRRSLF
jgi:hypothetical protein